MTGWIADVWRHVTAISVPLLVLALALVTLQTLLVALSWRNVLRAAYPSGNVTYNTTASFYAGAVGINSILPASAGTIAMLGLFRSTIEGSTVAGLVGAAFVENIFFVVVAACVYAWLFLTVAGSFDVHFRLIHEHLAGTALILICGSVLVVSVVRVLWRRFKKTWENAKVGGVIVSRPREYFAQVVAPQVASYLARMGVNATFMYAYGVPVSVRNVFLIVAASSISAAVAVTPGGVGAQTALTAVVLNGVAPPSVLAAYAVGQQLIVAGWNVVFGAALLIPTIGWQGARRIIRTRGRGSVDPSADSDDAP